MAPKKAPEGYISVPEAAKKVGVSYAWLWHQIRMFEIIPAKTEVHKERTRWFVKESDVMNYFKKYRAPLLGKPKKVNTVYQIVLISLGKMEILYETNDPRELSMMYTRMIEKQHKYIRIRLNGQVLTIHESDKVGYRYHSRMRGAAI